MRRATSNQYIQRMTVDSGKNGAVDKRGKYWFLCIAAEWSAMVIAHCTTLCHSELSQQSQSHQQSLDRLRQIIPPFQSGMMTISIVIIMTEPFTLLLTAIGLVRLPPAPCAVATYITFISVLMPCFNVTKKVTIMLLLPPLNYPSSSPK